MFLANTSTQAESLLHGLEQISEGIGLNMNANKTEFMYFKPEGALSILHIKSSKSVNLRQ